MHTVTQKKSRGTKTNGTKKSTKTNGASAAPKSAAESGTAPHIIGMTQEESQRIHDREQATRFAAETIAKARADYDVHSPFPLSELDERISEASDGLVRAIGLLSAELAMPDGLVLDEEVIAQARDLIATVRHSLRWSIQENLRRARVIDTPDAGAVPS